MPIFSSSSSWTNQAKNSGKSGSRENKWSLHPVCAPKRSSFFGSRKSWTKQTNNQAKERKANRGQKPARTLMGHTEDLRKIQKQQRVADRTVSRAADTANAAFKELDRAIRKGDARAIKRAEAKAKAAQKNLGKAQRARGHR